MYMKSGLSGVWWVLRVVPLPVHWVLKPVYAVLYQVTTIYSGVAERIQVRDSHQYLPAG